MSFEVRPFVQMGGSTPMTRRAAREVERYHAEMDRRELVAQREGDLARIKSDVLGNHGVSTYFSLARDNGFRRRISMAAGDPSLADDMDFIHRTVVFGHATITQDLIHRLGSI